MEARNVIRTQSIWGRRAQLCEVDDKSARVLMRAFRDSHDLLENAQRTVADL